MTSPRLVAIESVATPFELWCERHDVRPDEPWAWEHYEWSLTHPMAG